MREPRRIRIVERGWETYTGPFGTISFVNGVSVGAPDFIAADRVASEMKVVDYETNLPIGPQHRMIEERISPIEMVPELPKAPEPTEAVVEEEKIPEPTEPDKVWTPEELEDLADKEGIKGLRREIGDAIGAKGRAIPELIEDILRVQDERARATLSRLPREG